MASSLAKAILQWVRPYVDHNSDIDTSHGSLKKCFANAKVSESRVGSRILFRPHRPLRHTSLDTSRHLSTPLDTSRRLSTPLDASRRSQRRTSLRTTQRRTTLSPHTQAFLVILNCIDPLFVYKPSDNPVQNMKVAFKAFEGRWVGG